MVMLPITLALAITAAASDSFYGVAPVHRDAHATPLVGSSTIVRTSAGNFSATVQRVSRYPLPNATAAAGISALTFSFNNLFNTSTEPIEIEESTLNLWSGACK